jgi:DNA modification methylase
MKKEDTIISTQPELFTSDNDEEMTSSITLEDFHISIQKIKDIVSDASRNEVFHSLDVDVLPTDNFSKQNKINDLPGRIWIQETKSIWRQRGLGKSHPHTHYERLHPAPFSFQDVGRLIRFFTKKNELVLDPFCGIGSTLKACAILKRQGVGVELSSKWADLAVERLILEIGKDHKQKIICSDIRNTLSSFENEEFQFMVTSPPYWSILTKDADHKMKKTRLSENLETQYSSDDRDLGNIKEYNSFLEELTLVFQNIALKIESGRYMSIIVSDFRHESKFYPFHSDLYSRLCNETIKLVGVTILEQTHKGLYPYGYPFCYVPNIHHQYILIFQIDHTNKKMKV